MFNDATGLQLCTGHPLFVPCPLKPELCEYICYFHYRSRKQIHLTLEKLINIFIIIIAYLCTNMSMSVAQIQDI